MIYLTRLNKRPVVVNSDLIKFVEDTPDTVVTLVSGEKLVVKETVAACVVLGHKDDRLPAGGAALKKSC